MKRFQHPYYTLTAAHSCVIRWDFFIVLVLTCTTANATSMVDYVIHVSIDGLHAGGLQDLMHTQPARHTNFQRFVDEGATTFNARTDHRNTSTLPNHATMLTGRPVLAPSFGQQVQHGYINNGTVLPTDTLHNSGNHSHDYIASTFDTAHDHGLSTSLYATKSKFAIFEQSYRATAETLGGRPDQILADGDHGRDKIDTYFSESVSNRSSTMIASYLVDMQTDPYNYTFLHMVEPDAAGHAFGFLTQEWQDDVTLVDGHLGALFRLVETHPQMQGRTAIVMTSDHGGHGTVHSNFTDPNNYTVPFFVWGPGVRSGSDLYEVNQFTRVNPGLLSPSYRDASQPIRNGDGGNLALGLLGLPPIDGSTINLDQDLLVDLPQVATWEGTNPESGELGDGVSWTDPNNWLRGDTIDQRLLPADSVVFPRNTADQHIQLNGQQIVGALEFHSNITLGGGTIRLAGGELIVHEETARIHGDLSSRLEINKSGAGNLLINGHVSRLNVTEGTLSGNVDVDGNLVVDGVLAPGDHVVPGSGNVTVSGNFELDDNGILRTRLIGEANGPGNDQISARTVSLRGSLDVVSEDSYVDPDARGEFDRFELVLGRRVGAFSGISYNGVDQRPADFIGSDGVSFRNHVGNGLFRIFEYERNDFSVTNYRAIPGDSNGDGIFDSTDLVQIFTAQNDPGGNNHSADWIGGDWNGDGRFDSSDLITALQQSPFEHESILAQGSAIVPEPSCRWFATLSSLVVLIRFRFSATDSPRFSQIRGR